MTNGNKFTMDTYEVFEENGECRIIRTSDMNCFMELLLRQGGFLVVRLEGEDSIFNVYIETGLKDWLSNIVTYIRTQKYVCKINRILSHMLNF